MKLKKLQKQIEKYGDGCFNKGYDFAQVELEAVKDGLYEDAFQEGQEAEQQRIQKLLDMHTQWAMESGKGADIVFFTRMKEILTPVVIDYSIETYQEELRKDGF